MKIVLKEIFEQTGVKYNDKYFTNEIFKKNKIKIDENKSFYLKQNFDKITILLNNIYKRNIITETEYHKILKLLYRLDYKEFSISALTKNFANHSEPLTIFPETLSIKTIGLIKKIGIKNYKIQANKYAFDLIENIDSIINYIESIRNKKIIISKKTNKNFDDFLKTSSEEEKREFYYLCMIEKLKETKDFFKDMNEQKTIDFKAKEDNLLNQIDKIKEAIEFRNAFSEYTKEELLELVKQKEKPQQTITITGNFNFVTKR